uniref:Uncharacterized protein n=1 Tax=Panagrolaimus davidi TaxID=227884 RepID=A0A914PHF9_9BILA
MESEFSNQSLQLQWNERKTFQLPSTAKLFAAGDGKLYDDLAITDHPSAATRTTKSNSIPSMEWIGSNTIASAAPTSDVFATSYASTNKSKSFYDNSRQCPNSSVSVFYL